MKLTEAPEELLDEIRSHAASSYPNECCGVVIETQEGFEYYRCTNLSKDSTEEFKMCPQDYTDACDVGDVVVIVHSHPDASSRPSAYDMAFMERMYSLEKEMASTSSATPWWIISWPEGDIREVQATGAVALVGRPFVHGLQDCWQLCADYYEREHNISFPNYEREDLWWEDKDAKSLYEEQWEEAGFVLVGVDVTSTELKRGDMLVMEVGRTYHPNHAGIYLGGEETCTHSPTLSEDLNVYGQGPFMLHHMWGKQSEAVVFGGQWANRTRYVLRHKGVE